MLAVKTIKTQQFWRKKHEQICLQHKKYCSYIKRRWLDFIFLISTLHYDTSLEDTYISHWKVHFLDRIYTWLNSLKTDIQKENFPM